MGRMATWNQEVHASGNSSNLEGAFHCDDCYFFIVDITSNKKAKD
jgi:hypothetical protein